MFVTILIQEVMEQKTGKKLMTATCVALMAILKGKTRDGLKLDSSVDWFVFTTIGSSYFGGGGVAEGG